MRPPVRPLRTTAAWLTLLLLAGCGNPSAPPLLITGSSTVAPVIAAIAERYEQETGQRVDVQSGGSSRGISDVRRGLAAIGMVSRSLTDEERAEGLREHTFARDGIALIVHRDNPVASLDSAQARALWRGELRDWRAVGGSARPVTVVNKADGRSTLTLFLEFMQLSAREVAADLVAGENQQVILTVAGNRGAIGYVSIGAAELAVANGTAIRLLPLDGQPTGLAALRAGSHRLSRPLNLVTLGTPSPASQAFIDAVQSADYRALIDAHHYVATRP